MDTASKYDAVPPEPCNTGSGKQHPQFSRSSERIGNTAGRLASRYAFVIG